MLFQGNDTSQDDNTHSPRFMIPELPGDSHHSLLVIPVIDLGFPSN